MLGPKIKATKEENCSKQRKRRISTRKTIVDIYWALDKQLTEFSQEPNQVRTIIFSDILKLKPREVK